MFTVTEAMSPEATPAPPVRAGLELFVGEATGLRVTAGGTVSTVKEEDAVVVVFPASSDCSAWAVYVPSSRPSARPALHLPSLDPTVVMRIGMPDTLPAA